MLSLCFLLFHPTGVVKQLKVQIAVLVGALRKPVLVPGKGAKSDRDFRLKAFQTLDNHYVSQNYRCTSSDCAPVQLV